MSRPPFPEGEARSVIYPLRLRPDEKRELQNRAAKAGVPLASAMREGAKDWLARRGV